MNQRFNDGVIDLSQFKKAKEEAEETPVAPFFSEPCKIEFGDEDGNPVFFQLLMNIVYNDRQIVVIDQIDEQEESLSKIGIAEAIIKDGQFYGITGIEDEEEFAHIAETIASLLADSQEQEEKTDDEPEH